MIALAYVGAELVYNRELLDVASGAPTQAAMDKIEWIGRLMAGFGFSMVVWRMFGQARDDRHFSFRGFFWCVFFCLPIMWGLQEILIQSIVKSADSETLQSSLIVMTGRAAMKPSSEYVYVGRENIKASDDKEKDERLERTENDVANTACASNLTWMDKETFSRDTKTLWSLFGSLALNDYLMRESLQKKASNFARCRIKLTPFITSRQYSSYVKNTEQMKSLYAEYVAGSDQIIKKSKSGWTVKEHLEAVWRSNVDSYFGFDTSIKWGLSANEFNSHPDVMRMASERAGLKAVNVALGQDLNGFRNNLAQGVNFSAEGYKGFMRGGRFYESGEQAYKALLVPLIGLSLSLFFGLFNASILIFSVMRRVVGIQPHWLIAVGLIALAPMYMRSTPLVDTSEHKEMIASAHRVSPVFGSILEWTARAESKLGL
jgi:hypothetical protein